MLGAWLVACSGGSAAPVANPEPVESPAESSAESVPVAEGDVVTEPAGEGDTTEDSSGGEAPASSPVVVAGSGELRVEGVTWCDIRGAFGDTLYVGTHDAAVLAVPIAGGPTRVVVEGTRDKSDIRGATGLLVRKEGHHVFIDYVDLRDESVHPLAEATRVWSLWSDDTHAYWADVGRSEGIDSEVKRVPLAGFDMTRDSPETVFESPGRIDDVVLHDGAVFYTTAVTSDGHVCHQLRRADPPRTRQLTRSCDRMRGLTAVGRDLYYVRDGAVRRLRGRRETSLAPARSDLYGGLFADGRVTLWSDTSCDGCPPRTGLIWRLEGNGPPTRVGETHDGQSGPLVHDGVAYWIAPGGCTIRSAPVSP